MTESLEGTGLEEYDDVARHRWDRLVGALAAHGDIVALMTVRRDHYKLAEECALARLANESVGGNWYARHLERAGSWYDKGQAIDALIRELSP